MNIVTQVEKMQALNLPSLGFVPTMGHLHEGHLSLVRRAQQENKNVVVSIFVNPTQFNSQEDLDNYPHTLDDDVRLLKEAGVDYLFLPQAEEIYQDQYEVVVSEKVISKELEGEYRPGHFDGVLTVVLKLLNIVKPSKVYFGKKDYQQFLLIQKMVDALFLPVTVVGCETVREKSGLAMSSRNSRLSDKQKAAATLVSELLSSDKSLDQINKTLKENQFKVDYITEKWNRRLAAVWLQDVRLIDNVEV